MLQLYPEPRKAAVCVRIWSVNTLEARKVPRVVVVPSDPEELTESYCTDRSDLHQSGNERISTESVLSQTGGVEDHGTM